MHWGFSFPDLSVTVSTHQRQIRTDNCYLIPLSKSFSIIWGAECFVSEARPALKTPKRESTHLELFKLLVRLDNDVLE